MSQIRFSLGLFDTTSLAADGSNIPRRSCEEYLQSAKYKEMMRNKTAIGGLTHKDRKLRPELKGIVGMDDQQIINENALFYITRLYFKEGSNFLYADCETFDPDLFAGKRRENILNLQGQLLSGVRMAVSVVIQALWSKRGVAEKIIAIKGADFTQNPSFKGAGMTGDIKVFSEILDDKYSDEEIKSFSNTEYDLVTKAYNLESEIKVYSEGEPLFEGILKAYPDQKEFSYNEIVRFYGQGSEQEKDVRDKQGYYVTRDKLAEAKTNRGELPDEDPLYKQIQEYVDADDRESLQLAFKSNRNTIQNLVNAVPKDDPNREELIKSKIAEFLENNPNKEYSQASTVAERIRTQEQPRYTKFARTIKVYKQYWTANKLSDLQKYQCKMLFLQDINMMIKEVLPLVKKGQTFNSLYGLNQYGAEIKASALTLSNSYRKLLIAEGMMNFVPKGIYGEWVIDISDFYQKLLQFTFGEQLSEIQINLINLK
jgi:hypothetical protein